MRHLIAWLALAAESPLYAQAPVITASSVVNGASQISPGLPNYGIAQGSKFTVKGQNLTVRMPQFTTASSPLPLTLAGSSMQITIAGVAVKTGAAVSNFATVSISDGGVCSDPTGWSVSELQSGAPKNVAEILLGRINGNFSIPGLGSAQGAIDLGRGAVQRYAGQPLGVLAAIGFAGTEGSSLPSAGCFVFPLPIPYSANGTFFDNFLPGPNSLPVSHDLVQRLDAGAAFNVTGPAGVMQMPKNQNPDSGGNGAYQGALGGGLPPLLPPSPQYLAPGSYTVDNGSGGADVGAFKATLTIPSDAASWTGQDAISNIDRSQELTVTWSGSGWVEITGSSQNPAAGVGAAFACIAGDADKGSFTVPAWVLSSLPASGLATDIPAPVGFLALATGSTPVRFQARGIDLGYFSWATIQVKNVNYQ